MTNECAIGLNYLPFLSPDSPWTNQKHKKKSAPLRRGVLRLAELLSLLLKVDKNSRNAVNRLGWVRSSNHFTNLGRVAGYVAQRRVSGAATKKVS